MALAYDSTHSTYYGYAVYKVYDQYGTDITKTTLGNNLYWQTAIGTIEGKNGHIVVSPSGTTLLSAYSTAAINVYDTNDYVSAAKTLTVSQTAGVISSLTLNSLESVNSDDLNSGNTSGTWYIDYTALDADGNPTTDYTLLKAGLQSLTGGSILMWNLWKILKIQQLVFFR